MVHTTDRYIVTLLYPRPKYARKLVATESHDKTDDTYKIVLYTIENLCSESCIE